MQQLPNAYILMRVFFPKGFSASFLNRFKSSLQSVKKNKMNYAKHGGKLFLLIYDDTKHNGWNEYRNHLLYIYSLLISNGITPNEYRIIINGGNGSAYATYGIRKAFLEWSNGDQNAIAITLDQDDILREEAVYRISQSMRTFGIVVSPFEMQDNGNLDITDDGGKRHNRLARRLANGAILRQDLPLLSSIGWTKAYSRPVLERYHKDLTTFMETERGGAELFFLEHRAYEDFIDFYPLLYSDVHLTGTYYKTHVYIKHKDSITSSPSVEDFRNHRTASLIALIDLCYANKGTTLDTGKSLLCYDFDYKLFRFIASKVYQIEHIISKYRDDYIHNGANYYDEFAAQTHDGFFISKLCRLALGEIRSDNLQDKDLFYYSTGRGINSQYNFETLFSTSQFNAIPEYNTKIDFATPRFVLRKAVSIEKSLVHKESKHKNDDDVAKLYGNNTPPQKKRLTFIGINVLCWVAIAAGAVLYVSIDKSFKISDSQTLAAAVISVWLGILTYLLTERGKVKTLADEEASMQKLYYSEFTDFTRHLEANLKVMIQIRRQLIEKPSKRQVESIHFINLKWPESSCLFSDSMAKIISKDRVDDFARLRVNLRNINNSGDWLHSIDTSKTDILPDLEWEITRHIGYLLNMYYLAKNNFSFASQNELDMFVHENSIKNQLTGLFMDYTAKDRSEQIRFFIEKYYDDRRMKRAVLIH